MKLIRIPWREAIKRFRLLRCIGCHEDDQGQDWFIIEENKNGPYCPTCASKIATATDPTRSINQFYSNTKGTAVVNL